MNETTADASPAQPAPPPGRARRVLRMLNSTPVKAGIAVAILTWLWHTKVLDFDALKPESWTLVGLACAIVLPSFLIATLRFKLLLNGLGLECSYWRALVWTMIGEFWNVAMPGTGGDLMKAVYVVQTYGPGRRGVAAMCVLLDRIMGLWGLLCFGLCACLAGGQTISGNEQLVHVRNVLLAICLTSLLALLLLASPWIQKSRLRQKLMGLLPFPEKFEKIYQGFSNLMQRPGTIFAALGLSVLNHAVWCAGILALAYGLGQNFDPWAGMVVIPIALFANVFGFAGGFGVGEFAFDKLFQLLLNQPKGTGAALAFAFHLIALGMRLFVAGPFYILAGRGQPGGEIAAQGPGQSAETEKAE